MRKKMRTEKKQNMSNFGSRKRKENDKQDPTENRTSKSKRLASGKSFQEWLRSISGKGITADHSVSGQDRLSQREDNISEQNSSNPVETNGARDCELHDVHSAELQEDNEMGDEVKKCVICRRGEELLSCAGQGCKRCFHLSCLNPPLDYFPPGVWHCIWCVRKKIEFGTYAVSKGAESILDSREVISDDEVTEKQYLVKYKGLAHIHNCWISENQLLLQYPALLDRYRKNEQKVLWKSEWCVPQRFLDKRLLSYPRNSDSQHNGLGDNASECHYEWLIKWEGLHYSNASWELENASYFKSSATLKLKSEYEFRHQKDKKESSPSKEDKAKEKPLPALGGFSFGDSNEACGKHLFHVNKLREKWYRGQNAVVFDNQERWVRTVLFVLSLQEDVTAPCLIIAPSSAISSWQGEFSRWASSAHIIVYNGNRNIRAAIRTLEFYNKGGCIMFQVLISPLPAVIEDIEELGSISWGALIVDECQRPSILVQLKQIRTLPTCMRLLLLSSQLKERKKNYHSVLSFLYPEYEKTSEDTLEADANADISRLKQRMVDFIGYEGKPSMSKIMEYWVPVELSEVQIEQYCSFLISNSTLLCSSMKKETACFLHNIIISARKCCDHPYLVDQSLQNSVLQDVPVAEHLDVEIKLSGKLQLLEKTLKEIKKRRLRVLILFQSLGRSGTMYIGDILDDIIHEKFGEASYIRIDGNMSRTKKHAALALFNEQEHEKFACLMETQACLPTTEISSIDAVILFNSDWDPVNDIKALHKISLDSRIEQLMVFRLYSPFTVEEKVLILAKQGLNLDPNVSNVKQSICHRLLAWGASYLFDRLDGFPDTNTQDAHGRISSKENFAENVFNEVVALLPPITEENDHNELSLISEVQQRGGTYRSSISLLGESESSLMGGTSVIRWLIDREPPHVFWFNLLNGRNPAWKYQCSPSGRIRRKVYPVVNLPQPEGEGNAVKNVWRETNNITNQGSPDHLSTFKWKLHPRGKRSKRSHGSYRPGKTFKHILHRHKDKSEQRRAATQKRKRQIKMPPSNIRTSNEHDNLPATILTESGHVNANGTDNPSHPAQAPANSFMDDLYKELNRSMLRSAQLSYAQLNTPVAGNGSNMETPGNANSSLPMLSNHPLEASWMPQFVHDDPLQNLLDTINKEKEQTLEFDRKMRMRFVMECKKEIAEVQMKYDLLLQDTDTEFLKKKEGLENSSKNTYKNKILATAMQILGNVHGYQPQEVQNVTASFFRDVKCQVCGIPSSISPNYCSDEQVARGASTAPQGASGSALRHDQLAARPLSNIMGSSSVDAPPGFSSQLPPSSQDATQSSRVEPTYARSCPRIGHISGSQAMTSSSTSSGYQVRAPAPHLKSKAPSFAI